WAVTGAVRPMTRAAGPLVPVACRLCGRDLPPAFLPRGTVAADPVAQPLLHLLEPGGARGPELLHGGVELRAENHREAEEEGEQQEGDGGGQRAVTDAGAGDPGQ